MNEDLLSRLRDSEDGFTERKTESAINASELRRTLVAFANSVPVDKTAILFVGVADDGTPVGVGNPDSLQKTVRQVAEKDCYPAVKHQVRVFEKDGKSVVAVIVQASNERPHFLGPAFIRSGSESVAASQTIYEELIASRNSKAGKILRNKGQLITLKQIDLDQWGRHRLRYEIECRIEGCDAHTVDLHDLGTGRHISEPLEKIRINNDQVKRRMMLEVIGE